MLNFQFKFRRLLWISPMMILLVSCSIEKQISKSAKQIVLKDSSIAPAHIGISIYEPATNKWWFNYQGDHYFMPASNTKLATCYAAMKYLGDSLVGLRYGIPEGKIGSNRVIVIRATGDPTFLHPDFKNQPAFKFLKRIIQEDAEVGVLLPKHHVERWGSGWGWSDYQESYMAERNSFPIFGNVITLRLNPVEKRFIGDTAVPNGYQIVLLATGINYFDSIINAPFQRMQRSIFYQPEQKLSITRDIASNSFEVKNGNSAFHQQTITFATHNPWNDISTTLALLDDSLRTKKLEAAVVNHEGGNQYLWSGDDDPTLLRISKWNTIHSQPTDSLLKPMMHNSDNFFAEQSLLMVSNEMLGFMNDEKIVDTLLKTDFKDLPQKPTWVDGCGLSRYNLFTPQDFVTILNKMKNEFGMDRIKTIFATGNEGTLEGRYKTEVGYIFAKTGTLSGVVALSGFLYTKKNKLLIFSILVNNHIGSPTKVRNAIEKFIREVREKY